MLALEVRGVSKSFFGFPVLTGVDLEIRPGEVHGLVGENGAGKSTLMKILAGVYTRDEGRVVLGGKDVAFSHPVQAQLAGLSTVFQEFNLLPDRSVAENIYLGREPRVRGFISHRKMNAAAVELFSSLGVDSIHPAAHVRTLSVAQQQLVEIAKALSFDARIISMDEPTAALAEHEVELLYRIIENLKKRGVSVLYVSHRMREIFDLCDRITVLKDGALVATKPADELSEQELVRLMVGRPLTTFFPPKAEGTVIGDPALCLEKAGNHAVNDVTLKLRRGEILGIAGLQGAGRTEVLEAISGAAPFTRGELRIDGNARVIGSTRQGIRAGIAHVTEDRKATGLLLNQSVMDNALTVIRACNPKRTAASRQAATELFLELQLSARGPDQEIKYLSGGNQQKVILAKWLLMEPQIILLDEPTRGIDVGAKYALYVLMRRLAAAGHAILMVSSEMPELIGMADRILVMRDGELVCELPSGSSEESILQAAAGITDETVAA